MKTTDKQDRYLPIRAFLLQALNPTALPKAASRRRHEAATRGQTERLSPLDLPTISARLPRKTAKQEKIPPEMGNRGHPVCLRNGIGQGWRWKRRSSELRLANK